MAASDYDGRRPLRLLMLGRLSPGKGQDLLIEAASQLPADLRECLVLREIEELPYRDIALVVGVPIGTVMSRLFRARKLLLGQAQGNPE